MFKGISVTLLSVTKTGSTTVWTEVPVDNVLIAPYMEVDSPVAALPDGHRAVYHLGIPKTDSNRWEGQLVQFWNQTWSVVGIPTEGIEHLVPGPWNKKVAVELYRTAAPDINSLWRDSVRLQKASVQKDSAGFPGTGVTKPRTVHAIIPYGVALESREASQKQGYRAKMNAEVWQSDFQDDTLLLYSGRKYEIRTVKDTGRGTVMLECEEVWR